jgi:hypothetical protein
MSEFNWWATLYDPEDKIIAIHHVKGWATIDAIMLTWSLRYPNIEYIKLGGKHVMDL